MNSNPGDTGSCAGLNLKGNATITLSNDKGEKVVMNYDAKAETFSMDRTKSGKMDFSKDFVAVTKAPTYGNISQLRIFIDKSSIEALDADGKKSSVNDEALVSLFNEYFGGGMNAIVFQELRETVHPDQSCEPLREACSPSRCHGKHDQSHHL